MADFVPRCSRRVTELCQLFARNHGTAVAAVTHVVVARQVIGVLEHLRVLHRGGLVCRLVARSTLMRSHADLVLV